MSVPATRNNRRRLLGMFAAVTLLLLGIVGVQNLASNGPTGPATPAPAREVALPGVNTGWQAKATEVTLFGRLAINRPSSEIWDRGGEPDSSKRADIGFTDISGCAANCTVITFVDLTNPEMKQFFGDNPPAKWAEDSCTQQIRGELSGSKEFDIDGQTARYYFMPCGPEDEYSGHAWYVPGKNLFIMTYAGDGGAMSPEILRSVVDTMRWV